MTLKYMNADEIASNMMSVLGSKEFQAIHKKASFNKKAEEGDEDALLDAVESLDFEDEGEDIDVGEDAWSDEKYEGIGWERRQKPIPGNFQEIDEIDDEDEDEDEDEDNKEKFKDIDSTHPSGILSGILDNSEEEFPSVDGDAPKSDLEKDYNELDFATQAALKVAKTNLIKMANMFDKKGFAGIANILDQAVIKLSKEKKEKKEKKCICKGCGTDHCTCKPPCKCKKCK